MDISDYKFRISTEMSFYAEGAEEYDYLTSIRGEVLVRLGEREEDEETVVGFLHATAIHVGECYNTGYSLLDVADVSADLLTAWSATWDDKEEEFRVAEGYVPDLMIHVERVVVARPHRGLGLGLCLIHKLLSVHNESVVVLEPVPLQDHAITAAENPKGFEQWGLSEFSEGGEAGKKKLIKLYRRLGFSVLDNGWMIASGRLKLPSLDKVLKGLRRRANADPVTSSTLQ